MSDLSKIVYLSEAQYNTLKTNGTITVGNTTITYSADDLYLTPDQNIPVGGTTGQVLTKASNTDYDTAWTTPKNLEFVGFYGLDINLSVDLDNYDYMIALGCWGGTTEANVGIFKDFTFTVYHKDGNSGTNAYAYIDWRKAVSAICLAHYDGTNTYVVAQANANSSVSTSKPTYLKVETSGKTDGFVMVYKIRK